MRKPKVAFETLGCKANFFDTEQLAAKCHHFGLEIVPFSEEADAYVVNTCAVTSRADREGAQLLRRAHRKNPLALVIATGCSGELSPKELEAIPGVDAVFGTHDREEVVRYLVRSLLDQEAPLSTLDDHVSLSNTRARAYLKIQDGCNFRCSYCTIWKARGKSRSREVNALLEDVRRLVGAGYQEIVITGIHIGSYGYDLESRPKLADLLGDIFSKTDIRRIRLSSLDPECIDAPLFEFFAHEERLVRHLHLSLQSASDTVLQRMRRRTKSKETRHLIEALSEKRPGFFIAADVIAGFPGETEEEFELTRKFVEELPFGWLHVFPFSARPHTDAASMPHQIPLDEIQRRSRILSMIAHEKRKTFYQQHVGATVEVVVVSKEPDANGFVYGVSDQGMTIYFPESAVKRGSCEMVRIERTDEMRAYGVCTSQKKKKSDLNSLRSSFATASKSELISNVL